MTHLLHCRQARDVLHLCGFTNVVGVACSNLDLAVGCLNQNDMCLKRILELSEVSELFPGLAGIDPEIQARYRVLNIVDRRVDAKEELRDAPLDAKGVLENLRQRIDRERGGVSSTLADLLDDSLETQEAFVNKAAFNITFLLF